MAGIQISIKNIISDYSEVRNIKASEAIDNIMDAIGLMGLDKDGIVESLDSTVDNETRLRIVSVADSLRS